MGLRHSARLRSSKPDSRFMASANLELVRWIYTAWERGDYRSADWADPEIEYVRLDGPAPGSWIGLAGMAEAWRGILSPWEELRVEAEEYCDSTASVSSLLTTSAGVARQAESRSGRFGRRQRACSKSAAAG
jgi:ketosteroid isomerase-like protein